jgi:hypothetical protein
MEYKVPVKKEHYYKAILLVFSQLGLNLTGLELDIVANMLTRGFTGLNKDFRKIIREQLDINQFTFNNYIKRLKDKGVLIKEKDILKLNPQLEDRVKDNKVHITFEVYDN